MAIRFAAASGLALAAALFVAAPARAQSFFSFYEMSPRQIVGMLDDDGYRLRGAMIRRGDVYICDVTSVSGRSARLIVSARDGEILERYAATPRWRDSEDDAQRPNRPHDFDEGDRAPDDRWRRNDMALGDPSGPPPRALGGDSLFGPRPTPPAPVPDIESTPKPKHHAAKKHKEPSVAKAPATAPAQDASSNAEATRPVEPNKPAEAAKPADSGASIANVAPAATPAAPKPAAEPVTPKASVETKPATPTPTKTEAEAGANPAAPAKPKAESPKTDSHGKKINDLPVGTLD